MKLPQPNPSGLMEREPIGDWAELTQDGDICRRGHEPGGATDYRVVD